MPEVPHRRRQVRMPEIVHQPESQAFGCSYGNKGITAKIAEYLEREKNGCQQQARAVMMCDVIIHGIHIWTHVSCHTEFHKESPNHHFKTIYEFIAIEYMFFMELGQEIFCSLNWASYQLREERHK